MDNLQARQRRRKVAVIGGGASAVSLISSLICRYAGEAWDLDWYTDRGPLGRGIAYRTDSSVHLLNVRANAMGIESDEVGAFYDFAAAMEAGHSASDFIPRSLYGDYLNACVTSLFEKAQLAGNHIEVIPHPARRITVQGDRMSIESSFGRRLPADAATIAIGALIPRPLPCVSDEALTSGKFIADPWHFLSSCPPDPTPRDVAVIGLGLTAVDVILELSQKWPNARFIGISRHGLLPEEHGALASAPWAGAEVLCESMLHNPRTRAWMRLIRSAIEQSGDWRCVIDGLRPNTQQLWEGLPMQERSRFLRHARWAWERARHRVPPQTMERLTALEKEGRFRRLAGRLQVIRCAGTRLEASIKAVDTRQAITVKAHAFVQATGLQCDVRKTTAPLVQNLLSDGVAKADELGLGLQVDDSGRLTQESGAGAKVFALGSLTRGTFWESTSVPDIRRQASAVVQSLWTSMHEAAGSKEGVKA